jgi:hypothetical protein
VCRARGGNRSKVLHDTSHNEVRGEGWLCDIPSIVVSELSSVEMGEGLKSEVLG